MSDMQEDQQHAHDVREQERLARVEWKLETGFQGVHSRLDTLNGQVGRTTKWVQEHDVSHARSEGEHDGQKALRGSAYAAIGLLCAIASTAGALIGQALR